MNKIVAYSPLRISFGGGGTDISPFYEKYGGAVVNTTIDRGVTVSYTEDPFPLEISSRDFVKSFTISRKNNGKYVPQKILKLFEKNGINKGRIIINSDVPPGSGLGSSSALTTAVLKLIHRINGYETDEMMIAREAFDTEKDYFGITLGKQDPYAVSIGGFKFMEFIDDSEKTVRLDEYREFISELEKRTLLLYTGKTRASSTVLADQVHNSRKGEENTISNLKAIREIAHEMKNSVVNGDIASFVKGINAGWKIKKELGRNVSNPKIESIISRALNNGAAAARLMGGGSQGFVLLISEKNEIETLQREMMKVSKFVIRVAYDPSGTRILSA